MPPKLNTIIHHNDTACPWFGTWFANIVAQKNSSSHFIQSHTTKWLQGHALYFRSMCQSSKTIVILIGGRNRHCGHGYNEPLNHSLDGDDL